jgi:hypothetical protein
LATFQELNVHRWLCAGNPLMCPRLAQSTTVTFLSSQSTATDPVYLSPAIEGTASYIVVQGVLGAAQAVCTTTLGTITAKNRATPQLLKTTFASCAGAAIGQIVVDTTHPSVAWIYSSGGGGAWNMTQPVTPNSPSASIATTPTLVNWTNGTNSGDAVTVYTPVNVNIVSALPTLAQTDQATFANGLFLYRLNAWTINGSGNDNMNLNGNVQIMESRAQRTVVTVGLSNATAGAYNSFLSGGLNANSSEEAVFSSGSFFVGQKVLSGMVNFFAEAKGLVADGDVIIADSLQLWDSVVGDG